jgi:hypothetical protein
MVVEQFRDGSLTVPGAARRGNLAEYVVRYAIQEGHLPAQRRGGRITVRIEDLEQFLSTRQ